jgi:DNA-binding LytR/AlgR family response regulator
VNILIVEDEDVIAQRLERLLRKLLADRAVTIRRASSVADGLELSSRHAIDLLLLDLNLSGRSGFAILADAVSRSFQTVIVSAHEEQAIRAFEYGVTDFVPKPFGEARLRKALDRVFARHEAGRPAARYLAVRLAGEVRLIPIDAVACIRGAGDYAEIHCRDGASHLHDKSLAALECLLPSTFLRVHRSAVVNLDFVEKLSSAPGSRYSILLRTGERVPVSRARVAELRSRLL